MSELSLNNLKAKSHKRSKRLGRGSGSGAGDYSGRGIKGQKARSGGKGGLKRRGLKQLLRNKPKIGGFKSQKPKLETINLDVLEKNFDSGAKVDTKKLFSLGLIKTKKNGVKVLGTGKLTKKLDLNLNSFSDSAKKAIVEAGGQFVTIVRPKKAQKKTVSYDSKKNNK